MKITFYMDYHTVWGETIHICGSIAELGKLDDTKAVVMRYCGNKKWCLSIEVPDDTPAFEYHYIVKEYDRVVRCERAGNNLFIPNGVSNIYIVDDLWRNEEAADKSFFSSAFTQTLLRREESGSSLTGYPSTLTFKVKAPRIEPHQKLMIAGNCDLLGNWEPSRGIPLDDTAFPQWQVNLDASRLTYPIKYKFVIVDSQNQLIAWESDENRYLDIEQPAEGTCRVVANIRMRNPLPKWRGAGVAIPVFSLRSEKSFGIGDFGDLVTLVAWAKECHQKVIQILPINDTTTTGKWQDSYPYNANSIYALHPIYLDLKAMGTLANAGRMAHYEQIRVALNALAEIDYEQVGSAKLAYCRELYAQEGEVVLKSEGFARFFAKNQKWLEPYAAFRYLTAKYGTTDFSQWKSYATYDAATIQQLCSSTSKTYSEIAFHYYIQYHLHVQLTHAHNEACANGVVLKGDIPIGISRYSVDAWSHAKLFNMDCQAGAPPDAFSATGQNWGFPTYKWDVMQEDDFQWWRERFQNMAQYFDAYRIDHILGFFRIWQIPLHSIQGLLGYFNPALPLSVNEINNQGYFFEVSRFTKSYIREYFLNELFGDKTAEVIEMCLTDTGFGRYELKEAYNTQRKVAALLSGEENEAVREGLYILINEVLFIEDPNKRNHYHPRIASQSSYSYAALTEYERNCYDRLYYDFFYQRHNEFWKAEAIKRLTPLLASTTMLVCGEDLGMIPHSVPAVMNEKQILSLEIERMPKDCEVTFGDTASYPYLSVCTTSTHDMPTIRGWWEEDRELSQQYYNRVLGREGDMPYFCNVDVCEQIVRRHLASPAMLTVLPLQDWLSIEETLRRENPHDERINVPANSRHYWRYRMHLTLEQLIANNAFCSRLQQLVQESGR